MNYYIIHTSVNINITGYTDINTNDIANTSTNNTE